MQTQTEQHRRNSERLIDYRNKQDSAGIQRGVVAERVKAMAALTFQLDPFATLACVALALLCLDNHYTAGSAYDEARKLAMKLRTTH